MARLRFKSTLFLAVLLLAGWLIGQRLWTIHVERNDRRARAAEKGSLASQLEPSLGTIHAWQPKPEHACDDAAIAPRRAPDGEPWFAYTARSADGSVVEAMSRTPASLGGAPLAVGLREDAGTTAVIVFDVTTGQALCWTEEPGTAPLRDRARAGTARISKLVHVRE